MAEMGDPGRSCQQEEASLRGFQEGTVNHTQGSKILEPRVRGGHTEDTSQCSCLGDRHKGRENPKTWGRTAPPVPNGISGLHMDHKRCCQEAAKGRNILKSLARDSRQGLGEKGFPEGTQAASKKGSFLHQETFPK